MTENNPLTEVTVADILKMHDDKIQDLMTSLVCCIERYRKGIYSKTSNTNDFKLASDILEKDIKTQIDKIEHVKSIAQVALWAKEIKQNNEQSKRQDLQKETSQSKE